MKPLTVQCDKVHNALLWLCKNHPHYKDIIIDEEALSEMSDIQMLPMHVEQLIPDCIEDSLSTRYDPSEPQSEHS